MMDFTRQKRGEAGSVLKVVARASGAEASFLPWERAATRQQGWLPVLDCMTQHAANILDVGRRLRLLQMAQRLSQIADGIGGVNGWGQILLAELLAVGAVQYRNMQIDRRRQLQALLQINLPHR